VQRVPSGSRVRRLEQLLHRARDGDLGADHLRALDVEVAELLADEVERAVVGLLRGALVAEDADRDDLARAAVDDLVRVEAVHLADLVRERLVDEVGEILDRPPAQAVAPHARETTGGAGMPGFEHVLRGTADHDPAAHRLQPGELEVLQVLLSPALREFARRAGLLRGLELADGHDLAVSAVHELV
jgi:hypothetical protein